MSIQDAKTKIEEYGGVIVSEQPWKTKNGEYITVRCGSGHEWSPKLKEFVNSVRGCTKCYTARVHQEIHDIVKSHAGATIVRDIWTDYTTEKPHLKKIEIHCGECDYTWVAPVSRIKSGAWCKSCANKAATCIYTFDDFKKVVSDCGGTILPNPPVYKNALTDIPISCGFGHDPFLSSMRRLNDGNWCPQCGKTIGGVREEICRHALMEAFEYKYSFETTRKLPWLKAKSNLEIDCYNDSLKLGLEHHGQQHYEPCEHMHRPLSQYDEQVARDCIKEELCKQNGVDLIIVPYSIHMFKIRPFIREKLQELRPDLILGPAVGTEIEFSCKIKSRGPASVKKYRELVEYVKENCDGSVVSERYIDCRIPMTFKCNVDDHGEFSMSPNVVKSGGWCHKCGEIKRLAKVSLSIEEWNTKYLTKLNLTYKGEYVIEHTDNGSKKRMLKVYCQNNHEGYYISSHVLRTITSIFNLPKCPECSDTPMVDNPRTLETKEIVKRAARHGLTCTGITKSIKVNGTSLSHVEIVCPDVSTHPPYLIPMTKLTHYKTSNLPKCPECHPNDVKPTTETKIEEHCNRLGIIYTGNSVIRPDGSRGKNFRMVELRCPDQQEHKPFWLRYDNLKGLKQVNGSKASCPTCFPRHAIGSSETDSDDDTLSPSLSPNLECTQNAKSGGSDLKEEDIVVVDPPVKKRMPPKQTMAERNADRKIQGYNEMCAVAAEHGGCVISTSYEGVSEKMQFRCAKGHEFSTTPQIIRQKSWCHECSKFDKKFANAMSAEYITATVKKHGLIYMNETKVGETKRKMYKVQCEHHHEHFWITSMHLGGKTPTQIPPCNQCLEECLIDHEFVTRMRELKNIVENGEPRLGTVITKICSGVDKPMLFSCIKPGHGEFQSNFRAIQRGAFCPLCSDEKRRKAVVLPEEEVKTRVEEKLLVYIGIENETNEVRVCCPKNHTPFMITKTQLHRRTAKFLREQCKECMAMFLS